MSGTVNISRDLWDDTAFRDEALSERMALVWLAMRGRIIKVTIPDLAMGWFCAERRAAAIIKRLVKIDAISVHGGGAVRTIFIKTNLVQTCGLGATSRARFLHTKGGAKWRGGALPGAVRKAVIARDGQACAYCGDTDGPFHIDHVKAVALGGLDDISNLTVACRTCNLSKGGKSIKDWQARR